MWRGKHRLLGCVLLVTILQVMCWRSRPSPTVSQGERFPGETLMSYSCFFSPSNCRLLTQTVGRWVICMSNCWKPRRSPLSSPRLVFFDRQGCWLNCCMCDLLWRKWKTAEEEAKVLLRMQTFTGALPERARGRRAACTSAEAARHARPHRCRQPRIIRGRSMPTTSLRGGSASVAQPCITHRVTAFL